ncbi:MAG: cobyrinate a,c-diamide synthase, partial [Nitrososphaera sp.]|nr:cobyrinate a,c-diamide synthase [Nitrososphaera sp.]
MRVRRVVVAGVTSGVGKTTVAVAIMQALRRKGLHVQPFKVGPDFIDPSYHTYVSGRQSRNLDAWMMGKRGILECFVSSCDGADVAVIEGVMGLFDGVSGKDNFASTAHVARMLKAPVVLVVDASKAARSVAAIVLGFLRFDRGIKIAGVIINNVASDRHALYVVDALQDRAPVPVLGVIRRNSTKNMEERHLGLVPARELDYSRRKAVIRIAKRVSEQIQIENLLELCGTDALPDTIPANSKAAKIRTRMAVALDESFNFYYADNLDALRNAGAQLVFFSPVND